MERKGNSEKALKSPEELNFRQIVNLPLTKVSQYIQRKVSLSSKRSSTKIKTEALSSRSVSRQRFIQARSSTNLGPGSYEIVPKVPPLRNNYSLAKTQTERSKIVLNSKPETLEKYKPQNRTKHLKEMLKNLDSKILKTKQNKKKILQTKKLAQLQVIQQKLKKFEMNIRKQEVTQVAKSWMFLCACYSVCSGSFQLIQHKKNLRIRSQKIERVFFVLCIAIGKFKKLAKSASHRCLYRKLSKIVPYAKKWLQTRKKTYRKTVRDMIEKGAAQNALLRLMHQWYYTVLFLQKQLRLHMAQKKLSIALKVIMWNSVELKIRKEKVYKSKVRKDLYRGSDLVLGNLTIPLGVKVFYIKDLLYQKYKQSSPMSFSETEYRNLIKAALSNRYEWEELTNEK